MAFNVKPLGEGEGAPNPDLAVMARAGPGQVSLYSSRANGTLKDILLFLSLVICNVYYNFQTGQSGCLGGAVARTVICSGVTAVSMESPFLGHVAFNVKYNSDQIVSMVSVAQPRKSSEKHQM